MLLKAGANINAKDKDDARPVNYIFSKNGSNCGFNYGQKLNYADLMELLCKHGTDLDFQNKSGSLAFLFACDKNDLNAVQFLINHGADLLSSDEAGFTAIHYAAQGKNYEVLDFLLRSGVDINAKSSQNISTVHNEAISLSLSYVPIIFSDCKSPEFISTIWDLEFEVKELKKSADMIEFLVDNGAHVNTINSRKLTPLMEGVQYNFLEIVEQLLELKADVNYRKGRTYYLINHALYDRYPGFQLNTDFYADRINTWILLTAFLATKECDISEYCYVNSANFRWVHPLFNQCKTQVHQMKERTICGNRTVTFFDFLTKDLMDLLLICRSDEVMSVLKSGEHKKEFRLYKYMFERRMERVETLKNCENVLRRFLDTYFKKSLPLAVVDRIISHLTAGNLRNFGRALGVTKDFPNGSYVYSKQ